MEIGDGEKQKYKIDSILWLNFGHELEVTLLLKNYSILFQAIL